MITLTIPGQLPNLNDYTKACRSNAYVGAKMKKQTENMIIYYIQHQIPDEHIIGAVELHFRWYEPNKRRDIDNVSFAKKFLLDALVCSGTIESDGWKGVKGFTDQFFIDSVNPRVEVDIQEAGESDG